ncbi:MAG: hypothetical protein HQK78_15435, partial [Desulfobacterales bacterium]|nr:hypothetical protein [Desulfobacterales bacterium]
EISSLFIGCASTTYFYTAFPTIDENIPEIKKGENKVECNVKEIIGNSPNKTLKDESQIAILGIISNNHNTEKEMGKMNMNPFSPPLAILAQKIMVHNINKRWQSIFPLPNGYFLVKSNKQIWEYIDYRDELSDLCWREMNRILNTETKKYKLLTLDDSEEKQAIDMLKAQDQNRIYEKYFITLSNIVGKIKKSQRMLLVKLDFDIEGDGAFTKKPLAFLTSWTLLDENGTELSKVIIEGKSPTEITWPNPVGPIHWGAIIDMAIQCTEKYKTMLIQD